MLLSEQYYENGFFKEKVDDVIKLRLWNAIYSTEWIQDTQEGLYKEIPLWYRNNFKYDKKPDGSDRADYERKVGKRVFKNTPKEIIDIGYDLLETDPFIFFKTFYRNVKLQYIDLWNGSEEIDFHFDTINGCDTLVLIYLTEQEVWKEEWGGSIEMKKQVGNDVKYIEKISPLNGTMLVINNANPLVYHKVRALKNNSVNRYTFSFIYKWS
jgi:hypothetical protein